MATAMCANIGKVTKSGVRYLRMVGSISPRTSSRSAARAGDSSWVKAGTAAAELATASGTKRSGSGNRTVVDSGRMSTFSKPAAVNKFLNSAASHKANGVMNADTGNER